MQRHAFNGRTQPLTCLYAWVALLTTILDFMFYGSCNRTTWPYFVEMNSYINLIRWERCGSLVLLIPPKP